MPTSEQQQQLKYGDATGKIVGGNRYVLLNLVETNSQNPTYLAYDALLSDINGLVYFAIVDMGRGVLTAHAREKFHARTARKSGHLPWLLEEGGNDFVVLNWAPVSPHRPGQLIKEGRMVLLSTLGKGAFGTVFLAHDLSVPTPEFVAVKHMKVSHNDRQRDFQKKELELHAIVSDHPNIVTLRRIVRDSKTIFVVLDYIPEGDLFYHVIQWKTYPGKTELIKSVFLQLLDAVQYMHSKRVFHRDLKPENILTSDKGKRLYIADFGLATDESHSLDFGCGSLLYLCPESINGPMRMKEKLPSASTDIWALGVVLVNLVCGQSPWKAAANNDLVYLAYLRDPEYLRTILPLSQEFTWLLQRIFTKRPEYRITVDELIKSISKIETFYMTPEELDVADEFARDVARDIGILSKDSTIAVVFDRNTRFLSAASSAATLVGPITPEMGAVAAPVEIADNEDIPDILQVMGKPAIDRVPQVGDHERKVIMTNRVPGEQPAAAVFL